MAHIPDGVLSAPVLATGALVTTGLLTLALRHLDEDQLPQAAVLASAFFVSSLISIPLGPSSVHLLLNGLMGLLLGWMAVPALFVALMLQAAFFGFGGLVVLGVNTMNMALPALLCAAILRPALRSVVQRRAAPARAWLIGALAGCLGVLLTGVAVALSLALSGKPFVPAAKTLVVISVPLAVVEGLITATIVRFLLQVAPELVLPSEIAHD